MIDILITVPYLVIGLFLSRWHYENSDVFYETRELSAFLVILFWPIYLFFLPIVAFMKWFYRPDRKSMWRRYR